ncbi:MAG: alpha-amylase family glycosyl hydrolase [Candidatus Hodarchaeales archaeon]|jgi:hypothetical protein
MRISLTAREKYKLDEQFFTTKEGYVTFEQTYLMRLFVDSLNKKKDLVNFPELAVRASEINAITVLNEISHEILDLYKEEKYPELYKELLGNLDEEFGEKTVNNCLEKFIDDFPPTDVFNKLVESKEYLRSETEGLSNREIIIQELVHLWLTNSNPSFSKHSELFDDQSLNSADYPEIMVKIQEFFARKDNFGPENLTIIPLLETPAKQYPHSMKGQLEYIAKEWGSLLDSSYYYRILYALDIFAEEEKMRGFGPGESQVYEYEGLEERYTPDKDWMPNVLMIAKNAFVWLDQLSKKYQRNIMHLDQIPSEELIQLANWGFNALWLIGLWERSPASKTVKQWCGNPEAEASAYSLYDYVIADDLGGENSYQKLKEKASEYGIRLASDMVPNHTGIDSKWIREHPDWFISVEHPPFPSYQYSGDSLSGDPNFGIYLEDHYFSRTDAAVTFKHVDFRSGKTRYIYHGNDGTSMPWNDTAQLNYLIPEVRETVIQTILHVARKFSIIRFDAAMTLTRKHIQRLWFPAPGAGGDIPSRAGMGLTREDFMKVMPQEFWREVVDRINKEIPDTLLLAEAFWLLEGFFVRSLGMHRVYNSAFMNMLRDEDNAKYRSVMKNTLEYDPQILKRFVNFMSNPDEETAAKGFGKGEKYFGVCLLLVTLPGLPMFGHGVIEGYQEKYGMEYRRAYMNEKVDEGLVKHHERVIFPLMKKRYLYSDVQNFLLYDLFTSEGYVNENVICYSNGVNEERSLIVYNNFFGQTSGWIKTSVAYLKKEKSKLVQRTLTEGLDLKDPENTFLIFRDQFSGLEFIRWSSDILNDGLHVILDAYQSMALLDFREVKDNKLKQYDQLNEFLNGRGVPNIEESRQELLYASLHSAFRAFFNLETVIEFASVARKNDDISDFMEKKSELLSKFFTELSSNIENKDSMLAIENDLYNSTQLILNSFFRIKTMDFAFSSLDQDFQLESYLPSSINEWGVVLAWVLLRRLCKEKNMPIISRSRIDEWFLGRVLEEQLMNFPKEKYDLNAKNSAVLAKILVSHQNWITRDEINDPNKVIQELLKDPEVHYFLNINRYQDVLWFNEQQFSIFIKGITLVALLELISTENDPYSLMKKLESIFTVNFSWKKALSESEYKLAKFLELLQ